MFYDEVYLITQIAIIGAGISGLTLAQHLKNFANIVVFEKARGVGGRMSTRYTDPFCFDHGAQCFTARTKSFELFLKPFVENGTVAEWHGEVINLEMGKKITKRCWYEPHLVAVPNMNSLCKKMAEGITINFSTEVAPLASKQTDGWHLYSKEHSLLGVFDWIISTAPSAQTINLFSHFLCEKLSLHQARMQGCYALMLGINKLWEQEWIAAKVRNNPIKWISVNSTKPGRNNAGTSLVVHSRNDWAEKHIDDDIKDVEIYLLDQFEQVTGIHRSDISYISTHRWKYAVVDRTEKSGFHFDEQQKLAATSDWASTSRIEEVWINASCLADKIIQKIIGL